ncbi:hybrid sensor histidine kinase/response regulator transcription factor [Pelagicoccus mobilis]|uniref:histidine kinase n=1 Tax=Pelagicoccus mobilis TaxID=415221 RepID=A0A934VP89_9BACT|nr:ATP-binding protein [Pelagicoccus mobilis]MBK1875284.1 response regulator [Pelagicoccus mobilis]
MAVAFHFLNRASRCCLVLLVVFLGVRSWAATGYVPSSPDPFQEPWRWRNLGILADEDLTCISQAPDGALWIGSAQRIFRYDGLAVEEQDWIGQKGPSGIKDILAVSNDSAYALTIDTLWFFENGKWRTIRTGMFNNSWEGSFLALADSGEVWAASRSGLFRVRGDAVTRISALSLNLSSLAIDRDNRLWIGERVNGQISVFTFRENGELDLASRKVVREGDERVRDFPQLHASRSGGMFVFGNPIGVSYFSKSLEEDLNRRHSLDGVRRPIRSAAETESGQLVFADRKSVFRLIDGELDKLGLGGFHGNRGLYRPAIAHQLQDGSILLGGVRSPVYSIDCANTAWKSYLDLSFQARAPNGDNWFLSREGRVVRQLARNGKWMSYGLEDGLIDAPTAVHASKDGQIWVSGGHGGKSAVAYQPGKRWKREVFRNMGGFFGHLSVLELEDGTMLFGTGDEVFDTEEKNAGLVAFEKTDEGYLASRWDWPRAPRRIANLTHDGESLWFGSSSLYRKGTDWIETVVPDDSGDEKWVDDVATDSQGRLWVGIWSEGLFRLADGKWRRFSQEDGINSNGIVDLLSDDKGLWVATDSGISRYDGRDWVDFALPTGLYFERESGSLKLAQEGEIWVNRTPRDWLFRGSSFSMPAEVVEDFEFMTVGRVAEKVPPVARIESVSERVLEDSVVRVFWKGSDPWEITPSASLEYSYRVNGGRWSGFRRGGGAVLRGLEAGEYTLELRVRDLNWNIGKAESVASFVVVPPVWKRFWFLGLVLVFFALIVFLIVLLVRARVRHMLEIREFKLWFFTQISHEMRTPLSVILGPIDSVLERIQDNRTQEDMRMAKRNAQKMLRLVDQLLEFRKVEMGESHLRLSRSDLALFIREVFEAHRPLAEERDQSFVLKSDLESYDASFDHDKLQKIVDNLLSNAIKYTPEGGAIELSLEANLGDKAGVCIEVKDTGVGIPKEEREQIFKPFYRVKRKVQTGVQGTGIGLALTGELVEAMGATISVKNNRDEASGESIGSVFTVVLPLNQEAGESDLAPVPEEVEAERREAEEVESASAPSAEEGKATVLVVEDNDDVRAFLQRELEGEFTVVQANNGRVGFDLAKESDPDLVITDVMMPEMDGTELCRALKSEQITSHVPVIMLTARRSKEHELDALETGADDYLTKPIEVPILKARVRNLLSSREKLRQDFRRQILVKPKEVTVSSLDEQFLERAVQVVEDHLSDCDFTVEELARIMRVPRMTLFRKFKGILGQTPKKFITSMRLKRAAQLFKTKRITVSEVIVQVGFNDLSYFGACFKKEFKRTPTQYIEECEKERTLQA